MKISTFLRIRSVNYLMLIACLGISGHINAQTATDTLRGRNLYRPNHEVRQKPDYQSESKDSLTDINQDSLDARFQFIQDSIEARMQFIRDSILAREKFVRDSIQRRKEILDSVTFLRAELPRLLEASLKTFSDDVIIHQNNIRITGDSMLSDYINYRLIFTIDQPYTPWKTRVNLSDKPIKIVIDTIAEKIIAIESPYFNCSYVYAKSNTVLRINSKSSIVSKAGIKLYKIPIDSIFFNRAGNVTKIKRYIQFYQVDNQYRKGPLLFVHLAQVKQYEYNNNRITAFEITNFCDRSKPQDEKKVCNIMTYSITKQGNSHILTRRTDPANDFADGVFTYEFDAGYTLKNVSFVNNKKTENWKTIVEINDLGNVSRYVYQNKGIVHKTLLVNYYTDDPHARHKVETITCLFEDDGVSYYQVNNTTGKTRERDKMTMEWSPWR
ncbi:MAG: hypothetical protein PVF73_09880 [Bacteroidales bacterium]